MFVLFAEKSLHLIKVHIARIAAEIVIIKVGFEDYKMKEKVYKENAYQITMHLARKMLAEDLITKQEYYTIEALFTRKYTSIFGTLFSDIFLTSLKDGGIYSNRED